MAERHIVALGGGGFPIGGEGAPLLDYILGLARRDRPRVCFVPTASGDADSYVVRFYRAAARLDCVPSHLTLFQREVADLRAFVLEQDVVYVGGGNTASMLGVWRAHGLHAILREAWEAGVVLCGVSAGAICWFGSGITDSFGPELAPLSDALGFLPGSFCPHYDGEPERRPTYQRAVAEGAVPGGLAADDGCAVHFAGSERAAVVADRPNARAYAVERSGDGDAAEDPIEARLLLA